MQNSTACPNCRCHLTQQLLQNVLLFVDNETLAVHRSVNSTYVLLLAISTGVSPPDLDNVIGKLTSFLAGLIGNILQNLLV